MDRQIVYPGAIPLETDILNTNKYAMLGLSKLAAALLGTSSFLNGLACTPDSPASLHVKVAAGEIYSLQNIDGSAYSSLAADTTHSILKQGIALDTVLLSCPAPATAGHSINYLIQVAYQDIDGGAVVLPYYNASDPENGYAGPNNSGVAQNTIRRGACVVAVKAGVSATTGSQTTPSVDSGYVGAYVVVVANGQTTITSPNISTYSGAPFIVEKLSDKISQASADARYALLSSLAAYAQLNAAQTWTKAQRGAVVSLTDAATITPDLSLGNNLKVALGGNRTLGVPSNIVAGQSGVIDVWQDATGSRTLAYAWIYSWAGNVAGTLSTAAFTKDEIAYYVSEYAQSVVTISIASPGVVSWTGHGLQGGQKLQLSTTGALPTGLSAATTYYVKPVDANSFQLSATKGGSAINTSGTQSGVHTCTAGSITLSLGLDL